jgi:hypothetical protein
MPAQHIGGRKGRRKQVYSKIDPYLTLLNIQQLEKHDIQT